MVKQVLVGSYKQIDIDSPVYIRVRHKNVFIGRKTENKIVSCTNVDACPSLKLYYPDLFKKYTPNKVKLSIVSKNKIIGLDKKQARHCFGFYEVDCG